VLRKVFGPEGYELTGGWRKAHVAEHHDLYRYNEEGDGLGI
jgi:hypothetical protein